ncbi:MAG: glycosyltransferase family 2 protein [Stenomitos rutilans HA7619-LM2]|jgi:glycosyltransferase involved in cell wall biosynthesis|nr:glycosyltransferase family 2 protein [Stenomitos rutilans HA7619-LM2]
MKIHVLSMAHNEAHLLPYFISHYRNHFPDCEITIFDNESTDETASISQSFGCKVISVVSGGYVDQILSDTKNEQWKSSQADWVVVCDIDEFLQINQTELEKLNDSGVTILRTQGFDMVGKNGNLEEITDKYPNDWYSKIVCFKRTEIENINYTPGAHHCSPTGNIQWSSAAYELFHYKYLSLNLALERIKLRCDRASEDNRLKGIAYQYYEFNERKTHQEFSQAWRKAILWRFLKRLLPREKNYRLGHKLIAKVP